MDFHFPLQTASTNLLAVTLLLLILHKPTSVLYMCREKRENDYLELSLSSNKIYYVIVN